MAIALKVAISSKVVVAKPTSSTLNHLRITVMFYFIISTKQIFKLKKHIKSL